MKITAYRTGGAIELVPASPERAWMDAAHGRAPYRCLPLAIANGYGWELRNPVGFSAIWSGGSGRDSLAVMPDGNSKTPASSHFGEGILTFRVPFLFRTEPGVDLMVQGPINQPKDAIAPLTGIVETDWLPFTFTMNWRFTRAKTAVRFAAGEAFAQIFPVRRGDVETVEPSILPLSADPELEEQYGSWRASRNQFNADLKIDGSEAQQEKWQKHYLRGHDMSGPAAPPSHRTRLRPKPFREGE